MRYLIALIVSVMVVVQVGLAEDLTVEATVNKNRIALNEVLQLTVTVNGAKETIDPINLPKIDGFETRYVGPSTAISITNGQYHSQRSFIYQLLPTKEGKYTIPAIALSIEGKQQQTAPIDIEVAQAQAQSAQAKQPEKDVAQSISDKVKLSIEVPKATAFVREPILLTMKLMVNDLPIRDIQPPQIKQDDFDVGYMDYEQYQKVIDGVKYDIVDFKVPIYPKKPGPLTIGPAQINANMVYQQDRGQDDLFGGLFNQFTTRPITITSGQLSMDIKPLPTDGQPNLFSGAVGQFNFNVSLSPTHVKVGDPITVSIELTGDGRVKDIDLPVVVESAAVKVYEPKITVDEKGKHAQQVIMVKDATIDTLAPLVFTYFDPLAKEYRAITQGPFRIKVDPLAQGEEFKAIGYNDLSKVVVNSQRSVDTIDVVKQKFQQVWVLLMKLFHSIFFWLGLLTLAVITTGCLWWLNLRKRLSNDQLFYRKTHAYQQAKVTIEQARLLSNSKDCYVLLHKALMGFFADSWGVLPGSLSQQMVIDRLKTQGCSNDIIEKLTQLLSQSEAIVFGGLPVEEAVRISDLTQAKHIVDELNRKKIGI